MPRRPRRFGWDCPTVCARLISTVITDTPRPAVSAGQSPARSAGGFGCRQRAPTCPRGRSMPGQSGNGTLPARSPASRAIFARVAALTLRVDSPKPTASPTAARLAPRASAIFRRDSSRVPSRPPFATPDGPRFMGVRRPQTVRAGVCQFDTEALPSRTSSGRSHQWLIAWALSRGRGQIPE